jgi:hypothetical protein
MKFLLLIFWVHFSPADRAITDDYQPHVLALDPPPGEHWTDESCSRYVDMMVTAWDAAKANEDKLILKAGCFPIGEHPT